MRTDSCRKCGNELQVETKCNVCSKVNGFLCSSCGFQTEKQIHANCLLESQKTKSALA